ncbi:Cytochrome b245, heavy chain [Trema orientale]|uniref:ferric-chelate reductase (NADH) n=1 Tax=Trema orientale TaxID=63057 RepID=A0A2P5FHR0_TREOI|nr:Cytochrome b245, heavy chain [Trema orientale]
MDPRVVKKTPTSQDHMICRIRAAMRVLLFVLFMGFILIWIIMPTNTYKLKWQPRLKAKLNTSTYFGSQGLTLLIYTCPVLLFAFLGCVYIHLGKKLDDHDNPESSGEKQNQFCLWRQPMFVKGPLGIVTGTELCFFFMFIALLVWCFATYLHNSFATITPKSAAKAGEKVWQAKLDSSALRLGLIGNICLSFLFFPVARGSSVLPLFGLTSEASIKYHIWLGHLVMTLFTVHGLCYIIFWAVTDDISQMLKWGKVGISNVAGEISLLAGLFMWATTIPRIRRKIFELFFYTHYLYILFILFFILHVGISFSCIMLPGFYLFVVDRFLRFLQSRKSVRLISARILPCETLELNFSKNPGLKYQPTSTIFINVPSISKLQWHPFTITSSSNLEPEKLSVVIKSEGSWSKKLYQMLSSPASSIDRLEVAVEGPYGPVSTYFLRHETLVMVSGGSGITPFISIIRELIFAAKALKSKTPRLLFVSAFKSSSDLATLDLLLPLAGTPRDLSDLQLQIEAYVTREKEPPASEIPKLPLPGRARWFKPHPTDSPVSAVLGPNHWLWLGGIIASSFVVFLVLIGVITRYYIYPIDHNSNDVFSYALRAWLNILVICFAIAGTASLAVLWNKRENAMEAKQIQSLDVGSSPVTPMASPESLFYNAERELGLEMESLPRQSLAQATNVHYGQRPDLKKILFECKGSSIGVLVCGPKKLRHEVANICSSGLAENLHFESISFSW